MEKMVKIGPRSMKISEGRKDLAYNETNFLLQMKWNEAEMVALVGSRPADWEGKLTYRW